MRTRAPTLHQPHIGHAIVDDGHLDRAAVLGIGAQEVDGLGAWTVEGAHPGVLGPGGGAVDERAVGQHRDRRLGPITQPRATTPRPPPDQTLESTAIASPFPLPGNGSAL